MEGQLRDSGTVEEVGWWEAQHSCFVEPVLTENTDLVIWPPILHEKLVASSDMGI